MGERPVTPQPRPGGTGHVVFREHEVIGPNLQARLPQAAVARKAAATAARAAPSSAEGLWWERAPRAVRAPAAAVLTPSRPHPRRLLHYFRGRHHLEEIMYNENTRRSQLLALVDKFRSVLVVTTHEDPVIAVFQALLT